MQNIFKVFMNSLQCHFCFMLWCLLAVTDVGSYFLD